MRTLRAAALAVTTLFMSCDAFALSFDERWKSLFSEGEVAGDAVSAKAEMSGRVPSAERSERPARASRHYSRRHRSYASRRGERHREWYKGGRKWHYVYARRRGR